MRKYKHDHIHKLYLHTLFVDFFLFTLAGSIYGLITGGIGDLLPLPFYISFVVCTIFSVYKACSIIYDDTFYRRSRKVTKKNDSLSTDKSLGLEDLIDLSDQHILSKEQKSNPCIEGILTPKVVQDIRLNNKSNLVLSLNDKNYRSKQSSRTSKAHGTGSFISISPTNQAASRSVRSTSKPYLAGRLEDLLQSQSITNPIKSTVPTPPPMPSSNLFANKPKAQLRKNKIQNNSISILKLSDELLNSIRNFNQESLKKQKDLEQKDAYNKNTKLSGLGILFNNVLEERRQASAFSDSENDSDNHSITNSDGWEEDIKISPKIQGGSNNEVTKSCIKNSNRRVTESSTEKVSNNTKEIQKPSSLFYSSSLSSLNNIEESQKLRMHSSPSLNLEECRQHTYHPC